MKIILLALLAVASSCTLAATINKCVTAGKTVIQDTPCANNALPVKSYSQSATSAPAGADLARQRDFLAQGKRDREIRDLQYRIEQTEASIHNSRAAMSAAISSLQQKKTAANNNLAGAVWEQSISQEMSAVTDKHTADIQVKQSALDRMRKDLDDLRAKPQ